MNAIATLQEKPQCYALAVEHKIFSKEVRHLVYKKIKNICRVLLRFGIQYVMHIAVENRH
jgi:hypothetical protein